MAKQRIRSGDQVVVTTGSEKGKVGRVLRVLPDDGKIVVEGIRRVRRNQKPVGDQPGGVIEKELAFDISNVALWNAEDSKRVKVAFKEIDGTKVRVNRATGTRIDT
ncbi:MAG: 50S ribosomal protein L24 [Deltaproteobacteria bacterium]|nr:50S ribosomal protein L24 [Deltaproteobacteria bacterium]